ncbi:MAG: TetR/AcrR family transcriptional regulator [Planctomycetes bacterium]|nr:TetR/AcrR family transcriptional regulator [Planctomycetota bacterium]
MSDPSTKERLLDSAERLFAERGYAATSLRELTQDAGCNLAAVNYHFGTKEALVLAVLERRVRPVNEERLARLDALEAAGTPQLEDVLRAFVAPLLERHRDGAAVERVARLFLQLSTMRDPELQHYRLFQSTATRFVAAFLRALPEVDPVTVYWRITFMIPVVAMSFSDAERLAFLSGGTASADDTERALAHMVSFLAGGLRAPEPTAGGAA